MAPEITSRRGRLPSLLSRRFKRFLAVTLGLAGFMLANTLYLLLNRAAEAGGWTRFAPSAESLPKFLQAMVLAHTAVGLVLAVLLFAFLGLHLPKVLERKRPASMLSGLALGLLGGGLAVTGLFILTESASHANRWAWWAHVGAALLAVSAYAGHRLVSYARPPGSRAKRFAALTASGFALLAVVHVITYEGPRLTPEARLAVTLGAGPEGPGGRERPAERFEGEVSPESPFFPSPATTGTGTHLPSRIITRRSARPVPGAHDGEAPDLAERVAAEVEERGFAADVMIGAQTCQRCHPDVTEQWAASAHRFASFNNPFYAATIDKMREESLGTEENLAAHLRSFGLPPGAAGRAKSKWCSGCHDPALMLAGAMESPIDPSSVEAQAGLTCLSCHAIDRTHGNTGNGNYNIADETEDPYLLADAPDGSIGRTVHDAALRARPDVHRSQMLKPLHHTAEFCATCHKVSLDLPVNGYRWIRGQNEYDAWHDSGVAWNASRTFYLPPAASQCQTCHMPPEPAPLGDVSAEGGMVRSHRFLAVNTALPFIRGDSVHLRMTEEFVRAGKLTVDIFAARTGNADADPVTNLPRSVAVSDLGPAADAPGSVPGHEVTFDVVVRNRGVGHTFPGGTNDSNEGWLEFVVRAPDGEILAASGLIGPDGHLDPMAHTFRSIVLDSAGARIHQRNAQDIRVTAAANVIGPGTADVAQYKVSVPALARDPGRADGPLTVTARLLWRKFDRPYTEFAYRSRPEGFRQFADVPDLPVTEIAADTLTLVAGLGGDGPGTSAQPEWERYNDYGIANLLRGNTRLARHAFQRVAALAPDRVDGPLNLARTALVTGNLKDALARLSEAEQVSPGDPRSAWVWGGAHQADGSYDLAEQAYLAALSAFPGDRAAWFELGRTRYLARRYAEALAAFEEVLAIDREHRQAHYNRMLSLRALGRDAEADAAQEAFEKYSIDEAARALARDFLANNPGANLMSQPVHTHDLTVPPGQYR